MRQMRVKHAFNFPDQTIQAGTILDVEDEASPLGLVFILSGDLKFRSVHMDHLEELDGRELYQELLQRREEVAELNKRLGEAGALEKQRYKEYLMDINELHEERSLLLQQIERAVDEQKVALPRNVAEAIEFLRIDAGISDFGIIALSDQTEKLSRDYSKETIDKLRLIRRFALRDNILKALVNGYTIEETPESLDERIKRGVQEVYEKWLELPPALNADQNAEHGYLAQLITEYVQRVYAEQT